MFQHVRGSSHGFRWNEEMWFIVHLVDYRHPRKYYHMVLVWDAAMTEILKVTAPFCFEGQSIEYCLSLIVEEERLLCTYSTWDETTKIAVLEKSALPLVDWKFLG
jgi:hypothetical protein